MFYRMKKKCRNILWMDSYRHFCWLSARDQPQSVVAVRTCSGDFSVLSEHRVNLFLSSSGPTLTCKTECVLNMEKTRGLLVLHLSICICEYLNYTDQNTNQGARWPSGRASDSKSRGPGFDPHKGQHAVSLSKTH